MKLKIVLIVLLLTLTKKERRGVDDPQAEAMSEGSQGF